MENVCFQIFFGDKPYFITNHLSADLNALAHTAGTVLVNQPDGTTLDKTIQDIAQPGTRAVIILSREVHQFWESFRYKFTCIGAGGGVVLNDEGQLLMIQRRGMWDLPKGKWDEGESIEECAQREVQEETGLKEVNRTKLLTQTYHTYRQEGKAMLKTTWWFLMKAPGQQALVPQAEEDITSIAWVSMEDLAPKAAQSYASIRQVLALLPALSPLP